MREEEKTRPSPTTNIRPSRRARRGRRERRHDILSVEDPDLDHAPRRTIIVGEAAIRLALR